MKVGVLTGGGDCPGLNAVIRAIVRKGEQSYEDELLGFRHGWRGMLDRETMPLNRETTRGLLHRGGTILQSSRTNPYKTEGGVDAVKATFSALGLDALIAIGGEDTLGVAKKLNDDGFPVIGVPKTIDNDLSGTEYTFGFNTAVQIASEAIDRLHTTAESHDRTMVVEVMGRHAGWIALYSGLAASADIILIPERPFDINEIVDRLRRRHERTNFSVIVVAEGATPKEGTMATTSGELDAFGHVQLGGIANVLGAELRERTGHDVRVTILGHLLRGGTPTAYDRILATRFGIAAIDAVHDGAFGTMVALQADKIVTVPLEVAVGTLKVVDDEIFSVAEVFFAQDSSFIERRSVLR